MAGLPDPGRTALYRMYAADGQLLYVGIATDPKKRWKQHTGTAWWPQVARRDVQWLDTRAEAQRAELEAIKAEKPRFNVAHNCDVVPFTCPGWPSLAEVPRGRRDRLAALIKDEIDSGRWAPGQRIPSNKAIAKAAGTGLFAAREATMLLWRQGYLSMHRAPGLGLFVASPEQDDRAALTTEGR